MSANQFLSLQNKFLRVKKGVILTPRIDVVIYSLEAYFKAVNLVSYVTSGLRDAAGQLRIIRTALINKNLASEYQDVFEEDIHTKIIYNNEEVYSWQPGWSKLLNVGYIVNPPLPAKVLMDYFRPGSSENKKGKIIDESPHADGGAFDIGGGVNGVIDEVKVVQTAIKQGMPGIKSYLIERNNNCLHIDCE